jgi:opacity protein-like surface antigen
MRILLSILLFLAATPAQAGKINQGDWELGGGFNLTHTNRETSPATKNTSVFVYGQAQYFFLDHLSAGLDAGYSRSGSAFDSTNIGPVVTKYLWVDDKLAPFASMLPIQWNHTRGLGGSFSSSARVGVKYFLTDSVAVGPAFDYSHEWGSDRKPEANSFSFLGLFSIHL